MIRALNWSTLEMSARLDPLAEHGELRNLGELPEQPRGVQLPAIGEGRGCPVSESLHDGFPPCVEEPYVRASPFPAWLVYHQVVVVPAHGLYLFHDAALGLEEHSAIHRSLQIP